jgi:hypothetical protein
MSENNEQVSVSSEAVICEPETSKSAADAGEDAGVEKLVPVSEAIRYRRRAQAAEKELGELKESYEKQEQELAALKEQAETLENTARQSLAAAPGSSPGNNHKTQAVKEARTMGTRSMLQHAAKQAAGSGSRADVQEYLRLRRQYV